MKLIHILILEDDLEAVSYIYKMLFDLEQQSNHEWEFAATNLSEYTQVKEYVNKMNPEHWDIILLDRDCKACGSFHELNFDKFSPKKIISISSTPEWNKQAEEWGVERIVLKEFNDLDTFVRGVKGHLLEMLGQGR